MNETPIALRNRVIGELPRRRQVAGELGLPAPFYKIESSQIEAVAWQGMNGEDLLEILTPQDGPVLGDFHVIFKSKGAPHWKYERVTRNTIYLFFESPSPGRLFAQAIKGLPQHKASFVRNERPEQVAA